MDLAYPNTQRSWTTSNKYFDLNVKKNTPLFNLFKSLVVMLPFFIDKDYAWNFSIYACKT